MKTDAILSPCESYRYHLERTWDESLPALTWLMLNPSTADASDDDPTIRRCMTFARDSGYGGIVVLNLYAFRTPYPQLLWKKSQVSDPIGPLNDAAIFDAAANAVKVVAAWGAHPLAVDRGREVMKMLNRDTFCLGHTKDGHPRHPLYVRAAKIFEPYEGAWT